MGEILPFGNFQSHQQKQYVINTRRYHVGIMYILVANQCITCYIGTHHYSIMFLPNAFFFLITLKKHHFMRLFKEKNTQAKYPETSPEPKFPVSSRLRWYNRTCSYSGIGGLRSKSREALPETTALHVTAE